MAESLKYQDLGFNVYLRRDDYDLEEEISLTEMDQIIPVLSIGDDYIDVIDGGKLRAASITTAKLDFTPVEDTNVIASINASTEGIIIEADNIAISGATTFDSGYDPTDKVDETGGSYASAASGARVLIFPDANTGIQCIDDVSADVFKIIVGGTNVGDVIIGNYTGGQGLKYDKSAGTIYYKNLAWSEVVDDDNNKPDNNATVGAVAGTNLKDSNNTVLTDQDIINIKSMTAGETINGATLPVPVYQNTSDNEVYACDGNDTSKLKFIGFAISNSTDGNAIIVQLTGKVAGFTGLDEGLNYFVQDTVGTIGTTQGTYPVLVGRATSATELKIISEADEGINTEFIASDNLKVSADSERSTTSGTPTYVKKKDITIKKAGVVRVKFDLTASGGGIIANGRVYINGVATGTNRTTDSTEWVNFSEDFSGLNADDEVQLYLAQGGGGTAYCRNFRLYWDKITVKDYVVNLD